MPDLKQLLEDAVPRTARPADVDDLWRRGRRQVVARTVVLATVAVIGVAGAALAVADLRATDGPPVLDDAPIPAESPSDTASQLDAVLGPGWRDHLLVYQGDDIVHTMRLDGTVDHAITGRGLDPQEPTWDLTPQLSPDGTLVAFARETRTRGVDVWVADLDGAGQRPLTSVGLGRVANYPTWTPDGQRIVYTRSDGGQPPHELRSVRLDGSDDRFVAAGTNAAVSPDGALVLYENDGSLWTIASDGSGRPTQVVADARSGAWSPDGQRISYVSGDHVHVASADGSGPRQVTREGEVPLRFGTPSWWSPDGRWVIAVAGRDVVLVEVVGDRRLTLFPGPRWDLHWWWPS